MAVLEKSPNSKLFWHRSYSIQEFGSPLTDAGSIFIMLQLYIIDQFATSCTFNITVRSRASPTATNKTLKIIKGPVWLCTGLQKALYLSQRGFTAAAAAVTIQSTRKKRSADTASLLAGDYCDTLSFKAKRPGFNTRADMHVQTHISTSSGGSSDIQRVLLGCRLY